MVLKLRNKLETFTLFCGCMGDVDLGLALYNLGYQHPKPLGNGSSGCVYACVRNGEHIAVKCMLLPENLPSFLSEQKLESFYHPHIVELRYIDRIPSIGFIGTELLATDLMTILERQQRIEYEQAKLFFFQLCSGISYAHSKNIAHLDLKPENIFLDNQLSVRVGDWGSSVSFVPQKPQFGNPVGTFFYCSPEMLCGKQYFPDKCDLWSLGILLHTMVTGKWPYYGESEGEIYDRVRNGMVKIETCFGPEFVDLVSSLLQVEPFHRISVDQVLVHPWLASVNPQTRANYKHRKKTKSSKFSRFDFSGDNNSKKSKKEDRHCDDICLNELSDRLPSDSMSNLRFILDDSPKRKKPSITEKARTQLYKGVRKIIS